MLLQKDEILPVPKYYPLKAYRDNSSKTLDLGNLAQHCLAGSQCISSDWFCCDSVYEVPLNYKLMTQDWLALRND